MLHDFAKFMMICHRDIDDYILKELSMENKEMEIKKIAIIGAGALGVMYGSYLTKAYGNKCVSYLADAVRTARYRKTEFWANGKSCGFSFATPEEFGTADLVLFCVKYTAFAEAMDLAEKVSGKNTIYLSVLNGIASERDLTERFGDEHVLYCVAQEMDAMKEDAVITWTKMGVLLIGSKENRMTADLKSVMECFAQAGIAYRVPEDIHHALWSKLMLNTGINQCCAVYEAAYEQILLDEGRKQTFIGAMKEVQSVAACEGIILTDDEIETWVKVIASLKPDGYPSMRQDTLAKRRTEVELFSGTIRKLGEKYQVPTPINDFLYERIKEIEAAY